MKTFKFTPDWTKAPRWANWWAMDSDFYAHWFRERPTVDRGLWGPGLSNKEYKLDNSNIHGGDDVNIEDYKGYWNVLESDDRVIAENVYYLLLYAHSLRERPK